MGHCDIDRQCPLINYNMEPFKKLLFEFYDLNWFTCESCDHVSVHIVSIFATHEHELCKYLFPI